MKITIAHSPDADDAFMFYAIAKNKIDLKGYEIEHVLSDIQTLSYQAIHEQTYDITAISYHSYPLVMKNYSLMLVGSSMGDDYGPMLVVDSSLEQSIDDIQRDIKTGKRPVLIPGKLTSAYLALKLWSEDVQVIEKDFNEIQDIILDEPQYAGLIIHEGQVTTPGDSQYIVVEDLGKWWARQTDGLLLPLGCNVIRNTLSSEVQKDLSGILQESIQYSLDNKSEAIEYAMQYGRDLPHSKAEEFIGMYVNKYTLDLGEHGLKSIRTFYEQAYQRNLISFIPDIEL